MVQGWFISRGLRVEGERISFGAVGLVLSGGFRVFVFVRAFLFESDRYFGRGVIGFFSFFIFFKISAKKVANFSIWKILNFKFVSEIFQLFWFGRGRDGIIFVDWTGFRFIVNVFSFLQLFFRGVFNFYFFQGVEIRVLGGVSCFFDFDAFFQLFDIFRNRKVFFN